MGIALLLLDTVLTDSQLGICRREPVASAIFFIDLGL